MRIFLGLGFLFGLASTLFWLARWADAGALGSALALNLLSSSLVFTMLTGFGAVALTLAKQQLKALRRIEVLLTKLQPAPQPQAEPAPTQDLVIRADGPAIAAPVSARGPVAVSPLSPRKLSDWKD